ncbi:MAG: U32 family peptidase [Clostridia bacterium]|nr:U32 family peptidase [Clostridia bacterium]
MATDNQPLPELLCPVGGLDALTAAVAYGADAVYLGGGQFGMRATAAMDDDTLATAIQYAHQHGVKVYVTCNTIPYDEEMAQLPAMLTRLEELGADALIVADLGTLKAAQKYAPHCEIHVSVQAGIVNSQTATAFYELGAKRVVLAREMSLEQISYLHQHTPPELALECFVHGAMCVSFSGRCLLSSYMTGRDANRGECAQPCRWRYSLMEEKREGQYFDITESEKGTYILNANDLCMIRYLDRLRAAGVTSFKIEGRAKSDYYIAVVTNAYRGALNHLRECQTDWTAPDWTLAELEKISHRPYSTGFYFERPTAGQNYATAGYIRSYAVAAMVTGYQDGYLFATVKNKFLRGQLLDCLEAGKPPFPVATETLLDETGAPIDQANHPMMTVKIPFDRPVAKGAYLRMALPDET